MGESLKPEFCVRPGFNYIFASMLSVSIAIILALVSRYAGSEAFTIVFRYFLLPIFALIILGCMLHFLFYKVCVYQDYIVICSVIGLRKKVLYEDISKVELVFSKSGYSVPVRVYKNEQKLMTIVTSYRGYDLFLHKIDLMCKDKIKRV